MGTTSLQHKSYVSKRDILYSVCLFLLTFSAIAFPLSSRAADSSKTEADGACIDCVINSLMPSFNDSQFKSFKAVNTAIFSADPNGQTFIDPREIIDRSNPGNKQLNAIGMLIVSANLEATPPDYKGTASKPFKNGDKVSMVGTGFLINDCLVVTNHHVVNENVPSDKVKNRKIEFYAGDASTQDKKFATESTGKVVAEGFYNGGKDIHNDWAIVKLDKPIGKMVGHIGIILGSIDDAMKIPVASASFYSDKTDGKQLWGQKNCKILGEDGQQGNAWLTDCPAIPGVSGSPIFAQNPQTKQIFALGIMQSETSSAKEKKITYSNANNMIPFSKAFTADELKKIINSNRCNDISI